MNRNRPEKILVLSDSHGNIQNIERIIRLEEPFSVLVHCGDGAGDLLHVNIPENIRICRVMGNVDRERGMDLESIETEEIAGRKILIVHGDLHHVKEGLDSLAAAAENTGAGAAFFGHTHRQLFISGQPVLFNPGSAGNGFYGVVTAEGEDWSFDLRRL